jgi:hypothetical protein
MLARAGEARQSVRAAGDPEAGVGGGARGKRRARRAGPLVGANQHHRRSQQQRGHRVRAAVRGAGRRRRAGARGDGRHRRRRHCMCRRMSSRWNSHRWPTFRMDRRSQRCPAEHRRRGRRRRRRNRLRKLTAIRKHILDWCRKHRGRSRGPNRRRGTQTKAGGRWDRTNRVGKESRTVQRERRGRRGFRRRRRGWGCVRRWCGCQGGRGG